MLASQIDSVHYDSGDSILFPFKTLRTLQTTFSNNNNTCSAVAGASWLGSKIVVKPNGDNLFFNNN